jgi:hypothetical protein
VSISVDGHALASVAGQLDGNSLVPDTITPFSVRLPAGVHRLAIVRHGFTLAPGDDGSAVLDAAFLTPAGAAGRQTLRVTAPTGWRSLCGQQLDWIEAVPSQS